MPSPFSSLPFLIFSTIVPGIGLVTASIILTLDLRKMQQERKKSFPSVWYRRLGVRDALRVMGSSSLALLLLSEAYGPSIAFDVSLWICCLILSSVFVVGPGIALIRDLEKMHEMSKRGWPSVWHRHPGTLKHFGRLAFWLGWLLLVGGNAYPTLARLDNRMWSFFVPLLFFLSLVLSVYADALEKRGEPFS